MRSARTLLFAATILLFAAVGLRAEPLVRGSVIPDISASPLIVPGDYAVLGLSQGSGPVRLKDVKGEMLVVELFNRFCMSCLKQAAELERFYGEVGKAGLDGRIKVLAVGIGNGAEDLVSYKKVVPFSYPAAPDQSFDFYYGIGDIDSAPTTLFLRRNGDSWVLADGHTGIHGAVEMLARVKVLLEKKEGEMPPIDFSGKRTTALLTAAEKEQYAKAVLERAGLAGSDLRKAEIGQMDVYEALGTRKEPTGVYAVVAKRLPVCDLCHESLFAFAMDSAGTVKAFLPIYLTKFGNEAWSVEDERYFTGRITGRAGDRLTFASEVDAVTSATMSSSLVFDEARRASKLIAAIPPPK